MIEKLAKPLAVVTTDTGLPVTATHRAWGSTHQLWNVPEVVSYSVLGVLDATSRFRPIIGTEEYAQITGDDYAQLRASSRQGKAADVFRNEDVIARHKAVVARAAAEKEKATAEKAAAEKAAAPPPARRSRRK